MKNVRKESNISKVIKETEDNLLEKVSAAALKVELLAAMKTDVQSSVRAAEREIFRATVEETPRDIFLDGYETAEEGAQDTSYKFIKYVLTYMVAAVTRVSILALNFDKWSLGTRLCMR